MKTVFITRTKTAEDFKYLEPLLGEVAACGIKDIFVITKHSSIKKTEIASIPVKVIFDNNPISPISFNTALSQIRNESKKIDAFLVASKEVNLKKDNIKKLISEVKHNKQLLVAGYKLKIESNPKLNDELNRYYANKKLIAYKVPWNTCAIWSYELFNKYVSKFDEITALNPFGDIGVSIDGISSNTPHHGMEDGLAIAQAASNKSQQIYFKLLGEQLEWSVGNPENHSKKLARKETVMRNFMALRNYAISDLKDAGWSKKEEQK